MEKSKRKKSLKKVVLGATLATGLLSGLIFNQQIDEAIDVAQYYHYFRKYIPSEVPFALDHHIHQKILKECGIRNEFGEKVYINPFNDPGDEIFFKNLGFTEAYECRNCVEEQYRRIQKAARIWQRRDYQRWKSTKK